MAAPTPPIPKKREAKAGFTLVHAEGSLSYAGESYVATNGVAEVPSDAVAVLAGLGILPLE